MSRGVAGRVIGQTTASIRSSNRHVIGDDETREPLTKLPTKWNPKNVKEYDENRHKIKSNSSGVVPPS